MVIAMEEKYTFEDFVASLRNEFATYCGESDSNAEYTNTIFNQFLAKMAGTDVATTTNVEVERVIVKDDPVICTVFNHSVRESELFIINTILNIVMLVVAAISLRKN